MRPFWKEFFKSMMTTVDGEKPNWWLNGFAALVLLIVFLGVIFYG